MFFKNRSNDFFFFFRNSFLSPPLSTCYEKFIFVRTGNDCLFDGSLFPPTSLEKFFLVPNNAVGLMEINPPIKETSVVGILLWGYIKWPVGDICWCYYCTSRFWLSILFYEFCLNIYWWNHCHLVSVLEEVWNFELYFCCWTEISCLTVCFAHELRMEAIASFHRFYWSNLVVSVIQLMDESFIFIVKKWYCFLVRSSLPSSAECIIVVSNLRSSFSNIGNVFYVSYNTFVDSAIIFC